MTSRLLVPRAQKPWLLSVASCRSSSSFHGASHGKFSQTPPKLHNPFLHDPYLRECLSMRIPKEACHDIFKDLETFGNRIVDEIDDIGHQAEKTMPTLDRYDLWDNRIDRLNTSDAWKQLHNISAEEGLVAIGYERDHTQWSRLHQYAKLYLFSPSSGLYSCPLAMTDGAAKLIQSIGDQSLHEGTYPCLVTRDPDTFWTSGQWMTEKGGGSDVAGGTSTRAVCDDGNVYRLHGYKWFSSATDANMAFTLARIQDNEGRVIEGTKGLSLFYVETCDSNGKLNNILIEKLKNKLGTRQLPTAELLLDGTKARLIGDEGRGVANISPMLSITRLHNSTSAVGAMRRILMLARDYSTKRMAFGKYLANHPLHIRTLSDMEIETRGCVLFTLQMVYLLGKEENHISTRDDSLLLRLMTPVLKLYTAKQAVAVVSEGLECFGGLGYIEDTGLPAIYRDSQVLPIWEGTTNVLSLDMLRALDKSNGEALLALVNYVKIQTHMKDRISFLGLETESHTINTWLEAVVSFFKEADPLTTMNAARHLAFTLAQVYIGALLLEKACSKSSSVHDLLTVKRWCTKPLSIKSTAHYSSNEIDRNLLLVMDGYTNE